ncbi:UvrD/REP helicase N-terminal domain [Rubrobacter radiotolerans]|uniref:DNA 3'-5' helicase n=1 Tax=Rubrobacter radiotolerans TaxID=42256 RepID=A0A023X6X9_RUBRA|nr:ATP-dependent DNA helicase [Rubrobacter radiotolerans]AHY47829.1 UvrD/REP helicase N-terminal domain [Rubrobacter radiotolerans]MDX5892468.1 ATP-dependent DNA helicase [Rubrobacter radiotolerans]SMC07759.1 Superfamily I DNA or RNA helicase [Rubrobacter radiotolerans DSM 5868]
MSAGRIELNEAQRRAVEAPGGPLLVLAGPGTGKTGVIVARILHLIEARAVEPSRILALTFSRRAADGMQARLLDASEAASGVEVRTFHSFALRLVRRHHAELGLKLPPEILPTTTRWATMHDLLSGEDAADWNLAPGTFERPATVREVYDLMLRARENSCSPGRLRELGERHGMRHLVRAGHLLAEYTRRLKAGSVVDYEQVVQQAIYLLEEGHERLRDRYDHVLVDEFQDTNRSQLDLLQRLLPGERPNVFCVGDDAQSIYGFRGARSENVRDFEKFFPGAKEVQLRTNYRSAQPIVTLADAALGVERIARARQEQDLPKEKPGSVIRKVVGGDREEGAWISERILELRSRGVAFEEVAILRRSLLDSKPLVDALRSRGIPVDFSNTPARTGAGRLRLLLEAADTPEDRPPEDLDLAPEAASRALVSPLCGVSEEGAHALRTTAALASRSVFGMIRSGDWPASVPEGDRRLAAATVAAVDRAREEPDFLRKLDLLWKGLPGTARLFDRHREDARAARALADANAFLRAAAAYAGASDRASVAGFVSAGTVIHDDSDTWAPSAPPARGAVRLMTVHASKGLEFEAVFVSGLSDERFPVRSRGARFVDAGLLAGAGPTNAAELEAAHVREERRLFYVALTRAKTYLYLTGVEEASPDGRKTSPFLLELEERLASLQSGAPRRRFWASREEAVEELRRLACDPSLPRGERFAASRALVGMDERPGDPSSPWWRYVVPTTGKGPPPDRSDLREGEVVAAIECPRRAFMRRLGRSVGRSPQEAGGTLYGRGAFGKVFLAGFEAFLAGKHETLSEAVGREVAEGEFGGPAFGEHWRREVERVCPGCEEWAREVRREVVETGGEWTLEFSRRKVTGRHGPVLERAGERVHLKVSTGATRSQKSVEADPSLALRTLGAGAGAAEARFVREVQKRSGRPAKRTLGGSEGWSAGFESEVRELLEGLLGGDHPPKPRDEAVCGRCEFRAVCPAHREEAPWG